MVHLPTTVKAPAPFYNRFEKYLVTVSSMWEELLQEPRLKDFKSDLEQVCICFVLLNSCVVV